MTLIPISGVAARYGRCTKTIERWSFDPEMRAKGFPSIVRLRNRKYLPADQLENFDAAVRGAQ